VVVFFPAFALAGFSLLFLALNPVWVLLLVLLLLDCSVQALPKLGWLWFGRLAAHVEAGLVCLGLLTCGLPLLLVCSVLVSLFLFVHRVCSRVRML
jgi:hypothetical protein